MKNNFRFPPYLFLLQVAEHCPKALATYLLLWREIDLNHKISILKQDVPSEFLISLAKFRHDLLLLVKEGLISLHETKKNISIELVAWEEIDAEGKSLC